MVARSWPIGASRVTYATLPHGKRRGKGVSSDILLRPFFVLGRGIALRNKFGIQQASCVAQLNAPAKRASAILKQEIQRPTLSRYFEANAVLATWAVSGTASGSNR